MPVFGGLAGYKISLKHSKNEFVKGINHINRTESFWDFSKFRLSEFKEVGRENFYSI